MKTERLPFYGKNILIVISLSLFFGCSEQDGNEQNTILPFIVVGDNSSGNLILTDISPDAEIYGFRDKEFYYFDCNNDARNDFGFSIETHWGQGGGFLSSSTLEIITLTAGSYISTDTSRNPEIYVANDTITLDELWKNGEFLLLGFGIGSYISPVDYNSIFSGIWNDVKESYIGIKVNDNQLGWIKIDVSKGSIRIYEYAVVR